LLQGAKSSHYFLFISNASECEKEKVHLIFGLGNPGEQYVKTRHNMGFMILDLISERFRVVFKKGEGSYSAASLRLRNHEVILVKPLTFMNLSGKAVKDALDYYHPEDLAKILVISDDINLPFGTIRLRPGGSDGGQKGLRSIIAEIERDDFPRLRAGIGDTGTNLVDYVLSPFSREEQEELPGILDWAADAVESFILNGIDVTMSRYNRNIIEN